ncbi:Zinc finger C2H2-type [Sesbania bispinosa]|nr:Zinc finger C2H2-type [Sesbania bispinosa]
MLLSEMDHMEGIVMEEHAVHDANCIIKGKRTKRRLRPLSPCAVTAAATAMASSCSSASGNGGGGDCGSFSTNSFEGADQEEEDMAKCLILLAQGKGGRDSHNHQQQHKQQDETETENENHVDGNKIVPERANKIGLYIYECKTCNRTFPSFQALGGHRASHKKPKMMVITSQEEKKSPPSLPQASPLIMKSEFEEAKQSHIKVINPPVSLELGCGINGGGLSLIHGGNKSKSKIHECSICGSEFTSGQALGGHMRRHRASTININNTADVKPRNVLELDLNLPAPEDDLRESKFQFPANQKSLLLSPALVMGCHY